MIENTNTADDIKNLATLSRIELDAAQLESIQHELGDILGYVAQIKNVSVEGKKMADAAQPVNVFRSDDEVRPGGEYTEALLEGAPHREGNFVKVKNIF